MERKTRHKDDSTLCTNKKCAINNSCVRYTEDEHLIATKKTRTFVGGIYLDCWIKKEVRNANSTR